MTGETAVDTIRTFKPRRRALSANRRQRYSHLGPLWMLPPTGGRLEMTEVFGNDGPVVLDIGIGLGESCIELAAHNPATNIVGVDVHTPGIASALIAIDERGLTNVRLVEGDVFTLIDRIDDRCLAGIRVFFPDPWPKARHHRRRLVTTPRLARLVRLLRPNGFVHLATDSDGYAEQIAAVAASVGLLPADIPDQRPRTRYEQRGLDAGRSITDLAYRRAAD